MLEIAHKLTDGLASAYRTPILFKYAVEQEWRAAQIAGQDRAHLATIGDRPSRGCHPCHPDNLTDERTTARSRLVSR